MTQSTDTRPIPVSYKIAVGAILLVLFFTFTGRTAANGPTSDMGHNGEAIPPHFVPGSCTIFTASIGNKVLFGNNEDYINPNTYYWTIPSEGGNYGGVFFGFDNFWPQGGINEKGLAYDINALPRFALNPRPGRRKIKNPCYRILKTCATVEEAVDLASLLYWGPSVSAQIHFADATGDAVIISAGPDGEIAFTRKPKGDGFLVSTNFNRANPKNGHYPCWRYDKAMAMLKVMQDQGILTMAQFRSLLDAVHQEGAFANTVYSNVFDLKTGTIYLFHWHQFDEVVELHVSKEIANAGPPKRIRNLFSKETVEKATTEYKTYQRTITVWKTAVWIWFVLAAGSFAILILDMARRTPATWKMRLAWALSAVILGPFGLVAYWTASRHPQLSAGFMKTMATWRQALWTTVYGVTGHALGITGAFFTVIFIQPVNESSLWSMIARFYGLPLIVGFLTIHAPLWSSVPGGSYWTRIRESLLFDILFTNATLVGMFPVSCILMYLCGRHLGLRGPGNVLFWGVIAAGALAGVLTAYPLNAWMARRSSTWWPVRKIDMDKNESGDMLLLWPSMKTTWGILLVSTALLFGAVMLVLSFIE